MREFLKYDRHSLCKNREALAPLFHPPQEPYRRGIPRSLPCCVRLRRDKYILMDTVRDDMRRYLPVQIVRSDLLGRRGNKNRFINIFQIVMQVFFKEFKGKRVFLE